MEDLELGPIKDVVRRHWDSRAATFDEGYSHGLHNDDQRAAWIAALSEWAGRDSIDALDVGCGTGFFALLLAGLGHRPVGVDVADAMLARARAKAQVAGLTVDFRRADAERLPFADDSFDLVLERHVIWTLPDPGAALAEWARVLRPGGRLVLIEGDWRSKDNPDYAEIRDALPLHGGRPAAELSAFVVAHGFVATSIQPLMEQALWVERPDKERYAVHAVVAI